MSTKSIWTSAVWLGALMIVLFFPVLRDMALDWSSAQASLHGWFAIGLIGFLIWRKRDTLVAMTPEPSVWGWAIMGGALFQLLIGYFGGDFLIMRLSLWFSVIGLVLAMLGWPFLKALAFPVFVLLWTIRMPLMISTPLQVALQNVAELFAITFLRLVAGIAVYRDGDAFELSGARLSGVDLFSSMRVMVPVCFFAMAYAYLADKRITWRIGLPVLSLASLVAVASCFGILILWVSDRHIDTGNTLQGWLTGRGAALLALALMVAVHRMALLRRRKV